MDEESAGLYRNVSAQSSSQGSRNVLNRISPKIKQFNIKLTNDDSTQPGLYRSNSTLQGSIVLYLLKPTSIVRIKLLAEGLIRVGDAKKMVLQTERLLMGTERGRKVHRKLSAGWYTYQFSIELPADLPTTIFRNQELKAHYRLLAMLVRKDPSDDIIMERPFLVHSVTQDVIQRFQTNQEPKSASFTINNLTVTLTIPKTGFLLGQNLLIAGEIQNNNTSSKKVQVCVQIVRSLLGHGALSLGFMKIKQQKKDVVVVTNRSTEFFKVPKLTAESWEVEVPLLYMEPTSKHELIDIDYRANISITVQGMLSNDKSKCCSVSIVIAPPVDLSQYPVSYAAQAPLQDESFHPEGEDFQNPPTTSLYPYLSGQVVNPTAPAEELSDDDNTRVDCRLPSYEDVINGRF